MLQHILSRYLHTHGDADERQVKSKLRESIHARHTCTFSKGYKHNRAGLYIWPLKSIIFNIELFYSEQALYIRSTEVIW